VFPVIGFSCLGGAAFIYIGLRARRVGWWIPGIAYLAVGIAGFAFSDRSDQSTTLGNWAIGSMMAAWLASILHACLINSEWLRWQAMRIPWYDQLPPPPSRQGDPPPVTPTPWPQATPGFVPDPAEYYGAGPAATPVAPAQVATPPTQAPAFAEPVDINAATVEQLAALPGFGTARANHVVAERQARRGFGSIDEFASVARLAPHELVQVRRLLFCAPRQETRPVQAPGRVLDV
jgi:hypothetical protein